MSSQDDESRKAPLQLLVIECLPKQFDWKRIFGEIAPLDVSGNDSNNNDSSKAAAAGSASSESSFAQLPNGRRVKVFQSEWQDVSIVSWGDGQGGCMASFRNAPGTCKIDFVLMRSVTRGIHGQDSRNNLFGLMHAGIPSVNSLTSIYGCLERVITWGELVEVKRRLKARGVDFPLIHQAYYGNFKAMVVTPDTPCVAKVGAAQSGFGKIKLNDATAVADFKSLLALHDDHVTVERFVNWDWDGRLQKIGNEYRAFRRRSTNWKGNVGNQSVLEDMDMTPKYKMWIDECAKAFGGLDICGLDILHDKDTDEEFILELNDTAIGLVHKHAEADAQAIRDLVLRRMSEYFYPVEPQVRRSRDAKEAVDLHDLSETHESQDADEFSQLENVPGVFLGSAESAQLKQYARQNAELQKRVADLEEQLRKKKRGLFG